MTHPQPDLHHRPHLPIAGRWGPGHGPRLYTVDAYTGEPNGSCATADADDIDAAVAAARRAIDDGPWPVMGRLERAQYLEKLHLLYRDDLDVMHRLIRLGNAAPVADTSQVTEPLEIIRHTAVYAETERLFGRLSSQDPAYEVRHEPVGVVAAITPFCTPQATLLAMIAPALLTGCAVVVKPAPQTPLDALHLADLAQTAGFPTGVIQVLPIDRRQVLMEYLVNHPGIDKVAVAGTSRTGARVGQLCGARLRRFSAACGAKNAAIITEHADLDTCVASLKRLSFRNSGQHCANLTRLLIHESVQTEFTERLRVMMRSLKVGDPADPATDIGPLVSQKAQQRVLALLRGARQAGARQLLGAGVPDLPGWFVYPTLVTGDTFAPISLDEVYGPVVTVETYRTETEAVAKANATAYGLCAAVYTRDLYQMARIAPALKVGTVRLGGADTPVHAPWVGWKRSGTGHVGGPEGLAEYQRTKVITGIGRGSTG